MNKRNFNVVGNNETDNQEFAKAEKNSKDEYDHLKKLVTLYAGK